MFNVGSNCGSVFNDGLDAESESRIQKCCHNFSTLLMGEGLVFSDTACLPSTVEPQL